MRLSVEDVKSVEEIFNLPPAAAITKERLLVDTSDGRINFEGSIFIASAAVADGFKISHFSFPISLSLDTPNFE